MEKEICIDLKNVNIEYELHTEKAQTLKEYIVNKLYKRKYAQKSNDKLAALSNFNLQINKGERLGIIGHNGAGKSTLLKVIAGILKPTRGELRVDGSVQPLIEVAAGFNPEFSGRENIYLNGYMLGFSKKQIQEKENQIIDFAGLDEFIDVPVKYYSSGMATRLAFTIATEVDPDLLIFDEMLGAGDAAFLEKAQNRINSLVEKAKAVILVSHSLEVIQQFATRVIVMKRGQIIFDGDPKEAVEHYLKTIEN